jgi:Tfp pilus assembly protein PilV
MAAHRINRREAGFTLIEVMISILLTAVAVIGVVALYTVEARSGRFARDRSEATVLAEDKMEELRTMTAASITAGSQTGLDALGQNGGKYDRSWTVSGTTAPISYTVTVTWDEDGTAETISLHSERN